MGDDPEAGWVVEPPAADTVTAETTHRTRPRDRIHEGEDVSTRTRTSTNENENEEGDEGWDEEREDVSLTSTLSESVVEAVSKVGRCRCHVTNDGDGDDGYTIRPGWLAKELGLTVDEASAELCGLLSAVGPTATFRFVLLSEEGDTDTPHDATNTNTTHTTTTTTTTTTMEFTFPPDFRRKSRNYQIRRTVVERLEAMGRVAWGCFKGATAVGLLVSTCAVAVACVCVVVLWIVVLTQSSRGGRRGRIGMAGNDDLRRTVGTVLGTLRRLLWTYAVWGGPVGSYGYGYGYGSDYDYDVYEEHAYFREVAYFLSHALSCCTRGASYDNGPFFFWYCLCRQCRRHRHRHRPRFRGFQRLRRADDGWSRPRPQRLFPENNNNINNNNNETSTPSWPSSVVEFLFGPSSDDNDYYTQTTRVWKLRADVIVHRYDGRATLTQLAPYADDPTRAPTVTGLETVSRFRGVPVSSSILNDEPTFWFPELVAETSKENAKTRRTPHDDQVNNNNNNNNNTNNDNNNTNNGNDDNDVGYFPLLYRNDSNGVDDSNHHNSDNPILPSYLYERPHVFSTLPPHRFYGCLAVVGIHWVGAHALQTALTTGPSAITTLTAVLATYADLYVVLSLGRYAVLAVRNLSIRNRNRKRRELARALPLSSTTTSLTVPTDRLGRDESWV